MDPNQLNQLNSSMNQMNQMSYYQMKQEQMAENIYTGVNVNPQYQGYYIGGMTNLMSSPNNYSANNYSASHTHHQPSISTLNNSILTMPVALSDKPWTRASKDPSIIQRGTELFVGNLSLDTFENDLFDTFRDCGEIIDIRVHKNIQTKKCYAFIRFLNKDMLKNALNKNLPPLKGRKLKVTKSNENSTIFIGNIRKNWTNQDVEIKVKRIFPNCEKIEHFPDPNNATKNRGFCFVVFKNRNEAIKALNYVASKGGINIDGVPLTCDWADVVDEDDSNSRQIFIAGLDDSVDEAKVREVFSQYGHITDIILSKMHKSSKRKDLAFITFSTHDEAKNSVEYFKSQYCNDVPQTPSVMQENEIYKPPVLHNPLGENVNVSLAFSQQAMQAKKKVKETRKKLPGEIGYHVGMAGVPMSTSISNVLPSSLHIPQIQQVQQVQQVQNLPSSPNLNLTQTSQSGSNSSNLNATAMLAMMNIINMNKNNMNINPQLMTQMMTACFESIINQQPSSTQTAPVNPVSPLNSSLSNLNNLNSLNTIQLNPLTSLTPSSNQILSLGPNKLNKMRLKKIKKKRTLPIITSTNPNSA